MSPALNKFQVIDVTEGTDTQWKAYGLGMELNNWIETMPHSAALLLFDLLTFMLTNRADCQEIAFEVRQEIRKRFGDAAATP